MKYIRFNRVIFKRERERKMLISKKVFDERGRIIVLRLFPKFASKFLSWNRAISLSLSYLLIHSLTLGQRGCGGTPLITQNSFSFEREIHFQSTTFLFQLILEACLRQSWRLLLTRDTGIFHFLWNIIPVLTCDAVR